MRNAYAFWTTQIIAESREKINTWQTQAYLLNPKLA